jgi:CRISPR/Cas system-associated exonuclease Cas4 (RecB family)
MSLLNAFTFSQGSLQDFVDCPRRFELRYIHRLAWPAVDSEPVIESERRRRLGERFHRLAQRYLLGIPEQNLVIQAEEEELASWWQAFLNCEWSRPAPGLRTFPEIVLSAPFAGGRLIAKYDLLIIIDGPPQKAVIVDWKTSSHIPRRESLMQKLQTRVYPYLLVNAGRALVGASLLPEQIGMIYWYSAFPEKQHRFPYNHAQYESDQTYLLGLVEQIETMAGGQFPMVDEETICRWCTYRSLCDRGVEAGDISTQAYGDPADGFDDPFDFNFDSIEPVKPV